MAGVIAVGLLWPNKKIKKKKKPLVPHSKFSTTLGYTRQDSIGGVHEAGVVACGIFPEWLVYYW